MARRRQGICMGLDIGSSSLKAIVLEQVSGKTRLTQLVIAERPGGIDKEDTSPASFISKTLKDKLHLTAPGKTRVILSIGRPYIRLKPISQITASGVIDNSFDHAVWFKPGLVEDIPYNKTLVDYWVLSSTIKANTPVELMAVCADEQFISKHIIALRGLGFTEVSVEINHTAILRSVNYSGILGSEKEDFIFLDLGAKVAKMGIVRDKILIQVKDMMVGGNSITEALTENLSISLEEAEGKKREANFFPEDKSKLSREEEILINAAEPLVTKLVKEVNLFLVSYKFVTKRPEPKKILLSGGVSRMKGLGQALARELKKDVKIFNPLKSLEVEESLLAGRDLEEIGPRLSVAIGLALLPLEPKSVKTLNLIPVDIRPKRRATNIASMLTPEVILGFIFSVLLILYLASAGYRFALNRRLIAVEEEWNKVQQEASEIRKIRQTKGELTKKEEFVARVASEQYIVPLALKTLSGLIPDGAWLVNIAMSEKVEEVVAEEGPKEKAVADPNALPPDGMVEENAEVKTVERKITKVLAIEGRSLFPGLVPQIMTGLKDSQVFSGVSLEDFKEQEIMGKKIINFTIKCKITLV